MSISTAAIVNVVLDIAALGALAFVCRVPFRRAFQSAAVVAPVRAAPAAERERRAA
jgi:hypothetical protein